MRAFVTGSLGGLILIGWTAFAFGSKDSPTTTSPGPAGLDHADLPVTALHGTVFAETEAFGLPGDLAVLDDHLVVVDGLGNPAFHLVERVSGRVVASLGRDGEGPGEFRAPVSVDVAADGRAISVFDAGLQRITRVALRGPHPVGPLRESPTVPLVADGPVTQPTRSADGRVLALGFFFEGRLAEFSAEGELLGHAGPLPPNPWGVPPNALLHAYQGTIAPRPDRSAFAVGTRHADWLEIYGADGTRLRRVRGPFGFEPRFATKPLAEGAAMVSGDDLRFGYIDVTATRERIYALFSGRTRAGFPGRANYARHVHVFDWDGNFLETLELDAEAFTIAVDAEEETLYAVRHLPAPAVLRYALAGGW